MHKLRTVDVWDTLLRRDCHPECIKLATARHLLLCLDDLPLAYREQWALYQARLEVERQLGEQARAGGGDDEYEIADVLYHWLILVGARRCDKAFAGELAEYELQVEIARSFPDPGIHAELAMLPADRTVFLSDFYMGAAMLKRLLAAKGLSSLVPDGVVSCDVGLNKRSGRLFGYIQSCYGALPSEHVHVGDNMWSDVEAARGAGVTAIHYLPAAAHAERLRWEELFKSRGQLFEHLRASCRAAADLDLTRSPAFLGGVEAAPLFIGFALWIAEQTIRNKSDYSHYPVCEGAFFVEVHAALFPQQQLAGLCLPDVGMCDAPVPRLLHEYLLSWIQTGHASDAWLADETQAFAGVMLALEALCSSRPDCVVTGAQEQGATIGLYSTCDDDSSWGSFAVDFQSGVLFAVERWCHGIHAYVVSADECRQAALTAWGRLYLVLDRPAAEGFVQAPLFEDGEPRDHVSCGQAPSLSAILLMPFSHSRRRALTEFFRREQWSSASVDIQSQKGARRYALLLSLYLANQIRRLRKCLDLSKR